MADNFMNPWNNKGSLTYENTGRDMRGSTTFNIENMDSIMHQNGFFSIEDAKQFTAFNRYGWIDVFDYDQVCKEFLFFTKPDLYIFNGTSYQSITLNKVFGNNAFFRDAAIRHKAALTQLQYRVKDPNGVRNPFMCILSNRATSRMDLPGISAETNKSTPNIYGVGIDYRSTSIKSDNSFDFAIGFLDNAYLDIYTMVKAYDEYIRMNKIGEIQYDDGTADATYYEDYIVNCILPEQFSVYKFLVGSDGETILYYAKATGVFFTDVPRADFADPEPAGGFKFSVSFHANFIEDNDPMILEEFNMITPASSDPDKFKPVWSDGYMNNDFVAYPIIVGASSMSGDKRVLRHRTNKDYRLKWTDASRIRAAA